MYAGRGGLDVKVRVNDVPPTLPGENVRKFRTERSEWSTRGPLARITYICPAPLLNARRSREVHFRGIREQKSSTDDEPPRRRLMTNA